MQEGTSADQGNENGNADLHFIQGGSGIVSNSFKGNYIIRNTPSTREYKCAEFY
jgi:hypothetical protein